MTIADPRPNCETRASSGTRNTQRRCTRSTYKGMGCDSVEDGNPSRVAIHEVMTVSDELRSAIEATSHGSQGDCDARWDEDLKTECSAQDGSRWDRCCGCEIDSLWFSIWRRRSRLMDYSLPQLFKTLLDQGGVIFIFQQAVPPPENWWPDCSIKSSGSKPPESAELCLSVLTEEQKKNWRKSERSISFQSEIWHDLGKYLLWV